MGCVSSKLAKSDLERERFAAAADHVDPPNHIVSLTSTTYGVLNLDREQKPVVSLDGLRKSVSSPISYKRGLDEPEVINTWELMHDLHDEVPCHPSPQKIDKFIDPKSCLKASNQNKSAKKQRKKSWSWGKENKANVGGGEAGVEEEWGRAVLQPFTSLENLQAASPSPLLKVCSKRSLNEAAKLSCLSTNSTMSLSPFFDPELVESFEKELSIEKEQKEQIKMIISPIFTTKKLKGSDPLLNSYEKKCPPGGENEVVIYTTTLRGIRKTFQDCNRVRSLIEAYDVQFIERDTSMDSGFREELKLLMGEKGVRVPMVFVKGRLIGGADEMIKLEEGGKLSSLFQGIPAAQAWCIGCGGLRFVMCMDCNGSCKVLDENGKKTARCGECNENGLIQCPICC